MHLRDNVGSAWRKALLRTGIIGAPAAALLICASVSTAQPAPLERSVAGATARSIDEFYQARGGEPLWLASSSGDAPQQLLKLLGTAEIDGISKGTFEIGSLLLAVRAASTGDKAAVKRAEILLTEAFVTYARALQKDPRVGVIYVDPELKPKPSSPAEVLEMAAKAPSLATYLSEIGWMHPLYGQLRQSLGRPSPMSEHHRYILALNLERARALPLSRDRYVLVNTANQRLYMVDAGKVVDEMKVVAGRPNAQTPLMNAYIRLAVLNPYWNVPSDITARLASNVVKRGSSYLQKQGYQVVSDFGRDPTIIDAVTVDWNAVAAGKVPVQLRQLPGPTNSMGRVKFMFPNSQGVWLHDTPGRELFARTARLESAGCVRLEDAWRLGSWLFQRPLSPTAGKPERQLKLPEPVPVYITYLTAIPSGSSVRFIEDVYARDPPPLKGVVAQNPSSMIGGAV